MSATPPEQQAAAGFRLSPQQELVFASGAEQPGFRAQCAVRVDGLEPHRLRQALEALVEHHEILRTVFRRTPGMQLPSQVITAGVALEWHEDDSWDGASIAERLEDEARAPLEPSVGPLLRALLLRSPRGAQALVVTAHSLVADGASLLQIVRELRASEPARTEEPLQYADYAEWRSEAADAAAADAEDGASSPVLLFGRVPGDDAPFELRTHDVPISSGLADALAAAATSLNVQRAVLVEACWHACVHRLSGAESLLVTGASDGRGLEELRTAIGPFAQPLEVRTRFGEQTSVAEIVDQVRRARDAGIRGHDALTGAALERAARRLHLSFQSFAAAGFGSDVLALLAPAARFALQLAWFEDADSPRAQLLYDPRAYDEADVERIASAYETLLVAVGQDPSASVEELPIVPEAMRLELLAVAAGPQLDVPRRPYHLLFEDRAVRFPDRTAVRDEHRSLTYAELDSRANALAARLRELGVERNDAVGMCTYRSVDSVVAVLAILKSGGAYVPLNFEHPPARIQHQLAEAGAEIVVVEGDLGERLPPLGATLVDTDAVPSAATAATPTNVNEPDDLVYVMYTSGSTGVPKGVAVSHANLVNYSFAVADRLAIADGEELNFAVVSAISTDLGNTAIFPALLLGGCVNLIAPELAMDADAFATYSAEIGIDVLKITPSHLAALLGDSNMGVLPRRCLVVGGEALSWELVGSISSLAPSLRVVNHYGPTETTVGSCTFDAATDASPWRPATVPIGRPIAQTRAYVVDGRERLLPAGVAGELVLAGAGVASGYVEQPDETARHFVDDPFVPGERAYRTGDRARSFPDGTIEFLGRIDNQVKIRGFRVEPGEVEAALIRHPSVRQAAVKASESSQGGTHLVAYIVTSRELAADELQAFLSESLPDYMIPSSFVTLDAMPLTASGKVDRLALPDPALLEAERKASYVAPRDDVEQEICALWAELLGVERVGVDDDFFELGGHSLLATQVIMRVRRRYGDVPLQAMFMSPTPAGLAEHVRARVNGAEAAS